MAVTIVISAIGLAGGACEETGNPPLEVRPERLREVDRCDLPRDILVRLERGYFPRRSGDVLTVEWAPNQFAGVRHSTPWPYTQNVPLVLYGPGFIRSGIESKREVTVADLAPTFARLLGFDDFPPRDGETLKTALRKNAGEPPRLIVTVVWDGGGDDLLEQWPHAWPNLSDLQEQATVFSNATAGSTPSITPPIHSTIGTGSFPSTHGHTDMYLRIRGEMRFVWEEVSPRFLRVPTLGDLWDQATGNRAVIGAVARDSYHLGMLGHGAQLAGGDHDIAVFDKTESVGFNLHGEAYRLPAYVPKSGNLQAAVEEVDQRDGHADEMWLGNEISADDPAVRATPAWPIYQTQIIESLIAQEGFGADAISDLLYINYKSTDLAGHTWNLVEPEEREVLEEQDRQLASLIELLDERVGRGRYVLALTADHGISPDPTATGGWAISGDEVVADIHDAFDKVNPDEPLVTLNRGYQLFLDEGELRANDVSPADVAAFLRAYRVEDNVVEGGLDPAWSDRAEERLFLTALTPDELDEALACAE